MERTKQRLQFLILLSVFLPVVISALYQSNLLMGKDVILNWSIVVSALILCYLFLEINPFAISKRVLKITNICLLTNIFVFVPVLLVLGIVKDGVVHGLYFYLLLGSWWALLCLPLLLVVLIVVVPVVLATYDVHKEANRSDLYKKLAKLFEKHIK